MGRYEYRSVPDSDSRIFEIAVNLGDSLARIAKAQGSTVDMMQKLNPTATSLRHGQVLKYQKASVQRVITGWRSISTALMADHYNGGGDTLYELNLDYALTILNKGPTRICAN